MALFAAFAIAGVILFHDEFLRIACTNIWLNGVIIGATMFGVGLCFVDMFKLLPEYGWIKRFFIDKNQNAALPPRILRPVAMILRNERPAAKISANTLHSFLDIIVNRFEDQRESVRYITNTLIFLGLLGTFWGLVHTVGGFADLVGALNFNDADIMNTLQTGLSKPLAGMAVAFTSSLFGLAGSLIVGFLSLQVQLAQNAVFRELEENLSARAGLSESEESQTSIPQINLAAKELTKAVAKLEKTVARLT
ncbi:MAG: MotA/TolQ/ExbB proton channel family protein [Rickettsiales bacterium]|jgi:hypothetical protein|nr:MotA/TolQ/ExbB proton channel family protein [Rickettsiales bacterium]